jgi:hypothetical protein
MTRRTEADWHEEFEERAAIMQYDGGRNWRSEKEVADGIPRQG